MRLYAFVEMIPKTRAHSSGINLRLFIYPNAAKPQTRARFRRPGVVVAVAGMAKISPFEAVKTHHVRSASPSVPADRHIANTEYVRLFRRYWRLMSCRGEGKHRPGIFKTTKRRRGKYAAVRPLCHE